MAYRSFTAIKRNTNAVSVPIVFSYFFLWTPTLSLGSQWRERERERERGGVEGGCRPRGLSSFRIAFGNDTEYVKCFLNITSRRTVQYLLLVTYLLLVVVFFESENPLVWATIQTIIKSLHKFLLSVNFLLYNVDSYKWALLCLLFKIIICIHL